jgi:aldose 1-epimerase
MKLRLAFVVLLCSILATAQATKSASKISPQPFGTIDGKQVFSYVLKNKNGVEAKLTNFGATLISLKVPDRNGKFDDVVLGYDTLKGYSDGTASFGATVGRYANRIAKAQFTLDGHTYTLPKNNGPNTLHGGIKGFNKMVWDAKDISKPGLPAMAFTYISKDGEEGFPGTLTAVVTYSLTAQNELRIDYDITTDKATVQNLTHHSYFNLNPGNDILGYELKINADRFTPVDETQIPTGELRPVDGTPFDFRKRTAIGSRINQPNEQLKRGNGYDLNFVLNGESGKLRGAAEVYEPHSGRTIEVSTTEPGLQLYTGNSLNGAPGKAGKPDNFRTGLCLETQHFPDSPNHPSFPSTRLNAGQHYHSTTIYRFGTK